MRTFLPKAHFKLWYGQYLPAYRLFSESPWTHVPGGLLYSTPEEAEAAADAYMETLLNQCILAERFDREIEISEIEAWRRRKAAEAEAEIVRVFGNSKPTVVRDAAGNEVRVEVAKKRKRVSA